MLPSCATVQMSRWPAVWAQYAMRPAADQLGCTASPGKIIRVVPALTLTAQSWLVSIYFSEPSSGQVKVFVAGSTSVSITGTGVSA